VLTQDRLFSTLDSTTRRLELSNGRQVLLSDTVGFVRRLPHQLVEAFRSTLEETVQADLLLHVVDVSEPGAPDQISAVRGVLDSIGTGHIPELLVLNKADSADLTSISPVEQLYPDAVLVSAAEATGLEELADRIASVLARGFLEIDLVIPYTDGAVLGELRREAEVLTEDHGAEGTLVSVRLPPDRAGRYRRFAAVG